MACWVIDENTFCIASNQHDERCLEALYFTETIYRFHRLVLDHEGELERKYRRIFAQNKLLRIWFTKMTKNAGHLEYRSSTLHASINNRLDELRFDLDDRCYVGAALNADHLITSDDGDFREVNVDRYFKNDLNLQVYTISESINEEVNRR